MDSFQAIIGWKRMRKRILKLSFRFVPTRRITENCKKIAKNFKKLKKSHFGLILSQNNAEKNEKERK